MLIVSCVVVYSCGQHSEHGPAVKFGSKANSSPVVKYVCEYDNSVASLGIGLVMITDPIELFTDSSLHQNTVSASMRKDNIENFPVCSKYYKPDYGMMYFVCLAKTARSYKVLNNGSEVRYLPRTKAYHFITWEKYIMSSLGIRNNDQPLRVKPGGADTIIFPKGLNMFCPVKVQEDWLQVKYDCFFSKDDNDHEGEPCSAYISDCGDPATGWIKWREKNKVLIEILRMP